jgi:hypothetical protein
VSAGRSGRPRGERGRPDQLFRRRLRRSGFDSPLGGLETVQLVDCLDLFLPPCSHLAAVSVTTTNAFCASLSAHRSAAVLFKFLDVLVAAAQPVPRLMGGFCCAAGFNAHGAERNGGTAVEWCAHCSASR